MPLVEEKQELRKLESLTRSFPMRWPSFLFGVLCGAWVASLLAVGISARYAKPTPLVGPHFVTIGGVKPVQSPPVAANRPKLPPGWGSNQFNGQTYYVVPIAAVALR
jgi:hypothetical protein